MKVLTNMASGSFDSPDSTVLSASSAQSRGFFSGRQIVEVLEGMIASTTEQWLTSLIADARNHSGPDDRAHTSWVKFLCDVLRTTERICLLVVENKDEQA